MVEVENKYKTAKIYKLTNDLNDLVYYGSTIKKLSTRRTNHKADYQAYLRGRNIYITSFKIFEGNPTNVFITLVEEVTNCTNNKDLKIRERYYIENFECVNKHIPGQTIKEYYINNKNKFENYYINNKERIINKVRLYYSINKDRINLKRKLKRNLLKLENNNNITNNNNI